MNSGETERLWKLQASANSLVLEGKRDASPLIQFLQEFVFGNLLPDIDWLNVYKTLGMKPGWYLDGIKKLEIKEDPNLWIVPVLKGATCNKVVSALRKLGVDVYTYRDDLDKDVPTNDRDPNRDGSYVVGFKRTIEADEENKNKSANQLASAGNKGITLLERLLLGLGYFLTTGQHLDVASSTLCTGSRCSDGNVPSVDWHLHHRGVYVRWYSPDSSYDHLRSRSAVSLPA